MADSSLHSIDWNAVRKAADDCLTAAWSLVCFAEWSQDSEYDVNRASAHLEAIAEGRSTFRLAMEVLQPGLECATDDDSMRRSPVFDALALATAGRSECPDFRCGPVCGATAHEAAFELLRWAILWVEDGLNAELDKRGLPDHYVAGIDDLHKLSPEKLCDTLVRLERRESLRSLVRGNGVRQIRAWIDHEWAAVSTVLNKPHVVFVPTPLQAAILKALKGKAMKKQALADVVCAGEGSRLYRKGGIKELRYAGRVDHKPGVGYFRPDAPPVD